MAGAPLVQGGSIVTTIKVSPDVMCSNCPFGKPDESPWTGLFGYDCYARIFLGEIDAKAHTGPGLPEKCPLRQGPITVELREKEPDGDA